MDLKDIQELVIDWMLESIKVTSQDFDLGTQI